jgi:hypothetical protein
MRHSSGVARPLLYLFARFSASVYPAVAKGPVRMRYVHASVLTATDTPDATIARGLRRLICRVRFAVSLLEPTKSGSLPGLS